MNGQAAPWCTVCCTRHTPGRDCPGSLLATGPERHARKFAVTQGKRLEYYGVLIAEAGSLWRARIFTYPNMLWSVPGRRGTVKFVGKTPGEAESKAIEFLREHCESRRYTMSEAEEVRLPGKIEREDAATMVPRGAKEERHPCRLPVRFGERTPSVSATTANVSAGGMCIVTAKPAARGARLRIMLDVQAYRIPLVGTVAWVRAGERPGQSQAMGIQLQRPPTLYLRYVDEVQKKQAGEDSDGDSGESA